MNTGSALSRIELDTRTLILELRPDLRDGLGFGDKVRAAEFGGWLVTSGAKEYRLLLEDENFFRTLELASKVSGLTPLQTWVLFGRKDVQAAFKMPAQLQQYLQWFYTYGVTEHALWQWLTPAERARALSQPAPWPERMAAGIAAYAQTRRSDLPTSPRPWGVNLVGYAFGQLGIGEDVRMAARAMLAAEVPMTMLNFPPGADIGQNDTSMAAHVADVGPFAVNVFCLTALENGRFYVERGGGQFAGRYNIGYWPWELSRWPAQWNMLLGLVDEVWVSTRHTLAALTPAVEALQRPVPVRLMPMAVELGPVAHAGDSRQAVRRHFGLPGRARLFCFSFDLNSSIHRKNPQAAVDAFLLAFPAAEWRPEQVGLVIKVHKPKGRNAAWERLKALTLQDPRMHIVEETLQRPELLALYRACDCFVSLHRAEGFGRGIAEALQLGLHVITTGYSGNVDFCEAARFEGQIDLVRYRVIKVKEGQYPYAQGQTWANADIRHAASLMQAFVAQLGMRQLRGPVHAVPEEGWPEFSAAAVGRNYRLRLEQIRAQISA